ncbi:hypothetical protein TWF217_000643 [Orbilia oligospora]|nr:hypothetical protein TWF217_000643 [Orbilia oligospora]
MLHDLTTIDLLGRYIANPSPIDIDIRKDYQVPGYEGMVHCSSLSWSGPTNQSLDCGFVEPTCLVKESSNSCRTDNNSWPGIHLAVAFQALVCCTMLDWMLVKKKRYLDFEENFAHSSFRPENVERLVGHPSSSQRVRAPWLAYSSSRQESKLSQCTLYLVCISYRERSWTKREYGKPPGSWLQLSVCRRPGIYLP